MQLLDRAKITKKIYQLPEDKLNEISDFIEFLLEKTKHQNRIGSLEGIWENIGFEKLDLEHEISKLRKESTLEINRKVYKWNI